MTVPFGKLDCIECLLKCVGVWVGWGSPRSGQVRSGSASYHRPSAREMRPTARRLAEHTHTEHGEEGGSTLGEAVVRLPLTGCTADPGGRPGWVAASSAGLTWLSDTSQGICG